MLSETLSKKLLIFSLIFFSITLLYVQNFSNTFADHCSINSSSSCHCPNGNNFPCGPEDVPHHCVDSEGQCMDDRANVDWNCNCDGAGSCTRGQVYCDGDGGGGGEDLDYAPNWVRVVTNDNGTQKAVKGPNNVNGILNDFYPGFPDLNLGYNTPDPSKPEHKYFRNYATTKGQRNNLSNPEVFDINTNTIFDGFNLNAAQGANGIGIAWSHHFCTEFRYDNPASWPGSLHFRPDNPTNCEQIEVGGDPIGYCEKRDDNGCGSFNDPSMTLIPGQGTGYESQWDIYLQEVVGMAGAPEFQGKFSASFVSIEQNGNVTLTITPPSGYSCIGHTRWYRNGAGWANTGASGSSCSITYDPVRANMVQIEIAPTPITTPTPTGTLPPGCTLATPTIVANPGIQDQVAGISADKPITLNWNRAGGNCPYKLYVTVKPNLNELENKANCNFADPSTRFLNVTSGPVSISQSGVNVIDTINWNKAFCWKLVPIQNGVEVTANQSPSYTFRTNQYPKYLRSGIQYEDAGADNSTAINGVMTDAPSECSTGTPTGCIEVGGPNVQIGGNTCWSGSPNSPIPTDDKMYFWFEFEDPDTYSANMTEPVYHHFALTRRGTITNFDTNLVRTSPNAKIYFRYVLTGTGQGQILDQRGTDYTVTASTTKIDGNKVRVKYRIDFGADFEDNRYDILSVLQSQVNDPTYPGGFTGTFLADNHPNTGSPVLDAATALFRKVGTWNVDNDIPFVNISDNVVGYDNFELDWTFQDLGTNSSGKQSAEALCTAVGHPNGSFEMGFNVPSRPVRFTVPGQPSTIICLNAGNGVLNATNTHTEPYTLFGDYDNYDNLKAILRNAKDKACNQAGEVSHQFDVSEAWTSTRQGSVYSDQGMNISAPLDITTDNNYSFFNNQQAFYQTLMPNLTSVGSNFVGSGNETLNNNSLTNQKKVNYKDNNEKPRSLSDTWTGYFKELLLINNKIIEERNNLTVGTGQGVIQAIGGQAPRPEEEEGEPEEEEDEEETEVPVIIGGNGGGEEEEDEKTEDEGKDESGGIDIGAADGEAEVRGLYVAAEQGRVLAQSSAERYVQILGNVTLQDGAECDGKVILMINGNLTINGDFTQKSNGAGTGCIFVTNGNVFIEPDGPKTTETDIASLYDRIEAFIISEETIEVEVDIIGYQSDGMMIRGGVVAKNIDFKRNLGLRNNIQPAELLLYDPRYIELFGDILSDRTFKIREKGYTN